MTYCEPTFPYLTWDCADELEGRLKKTLYHGGKSDCMAAVSSAALADLAVSVYIAAAPSPKRKLRPGYIGSISKRLAVNPCTMMLGILYCERMRQINPDYLTKISSSDLFIVSLVVASKFLNDEGEDDEIFNDEWAEAGGLAVSTVNRLECEFLNAMKWKAYVNPKEFLQFCNKLETSIALKHGLNRGWFSYTDLTNLLAHIYFIEALTEFVHKVFQIMAGCTLVYGLSLSVLFSTIFCINATFETKSVADNYQNVPDIIHPFAHRKITRTRQNSVATFAEGSNTPQGPCTCEVSSHFMDRATNATEYFCKCPEVMTNRTSTFGSVTVRHEFFDKRLSHTDKERAKSASLSQNELKPITELENTSDLLGTSASDNLPRTNCRPKNHFLYEGFLNIIRNTNATKPREIVYHEALFPLGKFPTIDYGLLFDKSISFSHFGSQ